MRTIVAAVIATIVAAPLSRRIGQQVEVIGIIEDEGKPEADRFSDLPRIKMTAWVPVKDSCSQ